MLVRRSAHRSVPSLAALFAVLLLVLAPVRAAWASGPAAAPPPGAAPAPKPSILVQHGGRPPSTEVRAPVTLKLGRLHVDVIGSKRTDAQGSVVTERSWGLAPKTGENGETSGLSFQRVTTTTKTAAGDKTSVKQTELRTDNGRGDTSSRQWKAVSTKEDGRTTRVKEFTKETASAEKSTNLFRLDASSRAGRGNWERTKEEVSTEEDHVTGATTTVSSRVEEAASREGRVRDRVRVERTAESVSHAATGTSKSVLREQISVRGKDANGRFKVPTTDTGTITTVANDGDVPSVETVSGRVASRILKSGVALDPMARPSTAAPSTVASTPAPTSLHVLAVEPAAVPALPAPAAPSDAQLAAAGIRAVQTKFGVRYQDIGNKSRFIAKDEVQLRILAAAPNGS